MNRFEIEELVGLDLSSVEGVGQLSPVVLKGVGFDRRGGYEQSGAIQSTSANSPAGDPDNDLLGYDQNGFAGFAFTTAGTDGYRLVDGDTITGSTSTISGGSYSFIDRVGIYQQAATRHTSSGSATDEDAVFFVKLQDGTIINASDVVTSGNPVTMNVSSSTSGGNFDEGFRLSFSAALWVKTKVGKLIAGWASELTLFSANSNSLYSYTVSQSSANASSSVDVFMWDISGSTLTLADTKSSVNASGTVGQVPVSLTYNGPVAASFDGHAVFHNRRVYGVPSSVEDQHKAPRELNQYGSVPSLLASLGSGALIYSEFGYVNLVSLDNWFKVPFEISDSITALVSTPAGLLILGENEAFLMRSDPSLDDFQLQKVSAFVGHDSDFPPAALGGLVFVLFGGEVYVVNFGMGDVDFGSSFTKISSPFEGKLSFDRVTADVGNRAIIASFQLEESGPEYTFRAYRFDIDRKMWVDDPLDGTDLPLADNFPLPSADSDGYILHPNSNGLDFLRPYGGGTPTPMEVKWEDVDLGDKNLKKLWRRVRIYTNDDYSGTPELDWSISGSSGTISASGQGGNRFVFTLPSGKVGEKADFTVRMVGAASGDTLEPPVVVEAAPRYRER